MNWKGENWKSNGRFPLHARETLKPSDFTQSLCLCTKIEMLDICVCITVAPYYCGTMAVVEHRYRVAGDRAIEKETQLPSIRRAGTVRAQKENKVKVKRKKRGETAQRRGNRLERADPRPPPARASELLRSKHCTFNIYVWAWWLVACGDGCISLLLVHDSNMLVCGNCCCFNGWKWNTMTLFHHQPLSLPSHPSNSHFPPLLITTTNTQYSILLPRTKNHTSFTHSWLSSIHQFPVLHTPPCFLHHCHASFHR